jgi:hypothetical protein
VLTRERGYPVRYLQSRRIDAALRSERSGASNLASISALVYALNRSGAVLRDHGEIVVTKRRSVQGTGRIGAILPTGPGRRMNMMSVFGFSEMLYRECDRRFRV